MPEQRAHVGRWLWRLVRGAKTLACRHEFRNSDLALTGIAELPKPAPTDSYAAGEAYYAAIYSHPSVTHRVQWPCAKCGKIFFAHCGLDVLAGRGTSSSPNDRSQPHAEDKA